jgi:hypothetical protein
MADNVLFEKLAYLDRLTRAGIDELQARALGDALDDADGCHLSLRGRGWSGPKRSSFPHDDTITHAVFCSAASPNPFFISD